MWILTSGGDTPLTLRLPAGTVKTLGRTTRADFIVEAALVSRVHCRLTTDAANQLTVEDLGSTNGTQVNGRTVQRVALKSGDRVTVGRVEFVVSED